MVSVPSELTTLMKNFWLGSEPRLGLMTKLPEVPLASMFSEPSESRLKTVTCVAGLVTYVK